MLCFLMQASINNLSQDKNCGETNIGFYIALHWLKRDPIKVIRGIHHVLKPGGRFVAEFGGFMNCGGMLPSSSPPCPMPF